MVESALLRISLRFFKDTLRYDVRTCAVMGRLQPGDLDVYDQYWCGGLVLPVYARLNVL